MAKAASKEVATQVNGFTEEKPDFLKDSERGAENITADDLIIPRLGLVQDLSPQRKSSKPEYIEGADSGMMFNNVTSDLYGTELIFVPVFYKKEWLIWKLQTAGGGFMGAFESEKEAKAEWSEQGYDEEEYEIVDTAQNFVILVHEDKPTEEIVISMSKSKMKANRQLNTLVKMAGGDRFSKAYKLTAIEDTNKNDQSYYNFAITPVGFVSEAVYIQAEKFYNAVSDGNKTVNRDSE